MESKTKLRANPKSLGPFPLLSLFTLPSLLGGFSCLLFLCYLLFLFSHLWSSIDLSHLIWKNPKPKIDVWAGVGKPLKCPTFTPGWRLGTCRWHVRTPERMVRGMQTVSFRAGLRSVRQRKDQDKNRTSVLAMAFNRKFHNRTSALPISLL